MSLCALCLEAVTRLHPHNSPRKHQQTVNFPPHNVDLIQNCWVCLKFSKWIEKERPSLFSDWQNNPLVAVFRQGPYAGASYMPWRRTGVEVGYLDLDLYPVSQEHIDLVNCSIQPHFIPRISKSRFAAVKIANDVAGLGQLIRSLRSIR